tara:strand:- start:5751 stop:5957 length:207 start_codon:yes stop_codon:yes gene_type:complete
MKAPENRALTLAQKKEVLDRLFDAWEITPSLRLGQLLENAKPNNLDDLFYIEDYKLLEKVEEFALQYK